MSSSNDWSRSTRLKRKKFNAPNSLNYVFSEGKNSEPFYVEGIKKVAESSGYIIRGSMVIDHSVYGKRGKDLVDDAERKVRVYQQELTKNNPNKKISNVWVFFDYDGNEKLYQAAFEAIGQINKGEMKKKPFERTRWHACWSSYCFEEWLLLHFEYCETAFTEKDLEDALSKAISTKEKPYIYSKNDSDIFDKVYSPSRVNNAVKNANRLNSKAEKTKDPHRNPTTGVVEFATFFLENIF